MPRIDQLTGSDAAAIAALATQNGAATADLSNVPAPEFQAKYGAALLPGKYRLSAPPREEGDATAHLLAALGQSSRIILPKTGGSGYRLSQRMTLPEGTIISSDDDDVAFYMDDYDSDGNLFNGGGIFTLATGSGLENLSIDAGSVTRSGLITIFGDAVTGLMLRDLRLTNAWNNGIRLDDVSDVQMERVRVRGRAFASLRVGGDSSNVRISKVDAQSDRGFGIYLTDTSHDCDVRDVMVTDNRLEAVGVTRAAYRHSISGIRPTRCGDNGVSITGYECVVTDVISVECAFNGVGIYGQGNILDDVIAVNCGQYNAGKTGADILDYNAVSVIPAFGGIGRKNRIGFVKAIDTQLVPTMQFAVQLKVSTYIAHTPGETVSASTYRSNANIVYRATTGGICGSTSPTHTSGTASDGAVTWEYANAAIAHTDTTYPRLWSAGAAVLAGQVLTAGFNRYQVDADGTTGSTMPTHLVGSASDGGVTLTFFEQLPSNFDSYDNVVLPTDSTSLRKGIVSGPATNKNTILGPSTIRMGPPGRNLFSDILFTSQAPVANIAAPPGSIALRRDANANSLSLAVKDSGTGTSGWSQVSITKSGTTAQRLTLASNQIGVGYFDTDMQKPIWWDGSAWRDGAGSIV